MRSRAFSLMDVFLVLRTITGTNRSPKMLNEFFVVDWYFWGSKLASGGRGLSLVGSCLLGKEKVWWKDRFISLGHLVLDKKICIILLACGWNVGVGSGMDIDPCQLLNFPMSPLCGYCLSVHPSATGTCISSLVLQGESRFACIINCTVLKDSWLSKLENNETILPLWTERCCAGACAKEAQLVPTG